MTAFDVYIKHPSSGTEEFTFLLEYDGRWKMLHYYARDFFAPRLMSMAIENDQLVIYIIQDTDQDTSSGKLTVTCNTWDSFTPYSQITIPVKMVSC